MQLLRAAAIVPCGGSVVDVVYEVMTVLLYCLSAYHTYLLYPRTYTLTNLHTYILTYLHTYKLTYLHTYILMGFTHMLRCS